MSVLDGLTKTDITPSLLKTKEPTISPLVALEKDHRLQSVALQTRLPLKMVLFCLSSSKLKEAYNRIIKKNLNEQLNDKAVDTFLLGV